MTTSEPGPRRPPAGAAVLREDVTTAIHAAVLAEMAAVGFGRLSIEGVARRAGVGKTAVYRRWSSKTKLVLDVISAFSALGLPAPSTGSLYGDLTELLEVVARALRNPLVMRIVPDLLVEAARNPELAETVTASLVTHASAIASGILNEAVARGDVAAGIDPERILEMTLAPLYWRTAVVRRELSAGYVDELARAAVAALTSS